MCVIKSSVFVAVAALVVGCGPSQPSQRESLAEWRWPPVRPATRRSPPPSSSPSESPGTESPGTNSEDPPRISEPVGGIEDADLAALALETAREPPLSGADSTVQAHEPNAPTPTAARVPDADVHAVPTLNSDRAADLEILSVRSDAETWSPSLGGFALGQSPRQARAVCRRLGGRWAPSRETGADLRLCDGLPVDALPIVDVGPPIFAYQSVTPFRKVMFALCGRRVCSMTMGVSEPYREDGTFVVVSGVVSSVLGSAVMEERASPRTSRLVSMAGVEASWTPSSSLRVSLLATIVQIGHGVEAVRRRTITTILTISEASE